MRLRDARTRRYLLLSLLHFEISLRFFPDEDSTILKRRNGFIIMRVRVSADLYTLFSLSLSLSLSLYVA